MNQPLDTILKIRGVCKTYSPKKVLYDVNLDVKQGQFLALVGPSGCGKTTLLRQIHGTSHPTEGEVIVSGKQVTGPTPDVGIVYQQYSLYDFMTTMENIIAGPSWFHTSIPFRTCRPFSWRKLRKEYIKEAEKWLVKLKLEGSEDKYPADLSGGMRQRVAIAQSLIMKPKILLLDEPFGALDEVTREKLQIMMREMYQENVQAVHDKKTPPYTIIIVTHELNEACIVSDRVIGLSQYWKDPLPGVDKGKIFRTGSECGATIVYDKASPTFKPDEAADVQKFLDIKTEIRKVVLDCDPNTHPHEHVCFWTDLCNGKGTGIYGGREICIGSKSPSP